MATKRCKNCKGTGHDKAGLPVIRRDRVKTPNGFRNKHVTVKLGSGCLSCGGIGVIPCKTS